MHGESILAGEMAAMIGIWLRDDSGTRFAADAFATSASALRSALWLWLEDDLRAMGCLRPVVDQLARMRTWRLKPEAAAKLEANPQTTPRDWLEAAGWRRLTLLSRALGEYVHGTVEVAHNTARRALVSLQTSPDDPLSQLTGRTHALSALVHFVAVESGTWLRRIDPTVADAYWRVVRLDEKSAEKGLETLLA
jgi:hypothetical protein